MRPLALALAAALVPLAACDEAPAAAQADAKSWPPGTVLAVGDIPITSEEVDYASVFFERIEPQSSPEQLRRLAITQVALPRAVARSLAPQEYLEAKKRAEEALASVRDGAPMVGPPGQAANSAERVTGTWQDLGFLAWGTAMDLPEGQWSEVIEEVGHFIVLRRVARKDGPVPVATEVTVDGFVFPWLPKEGMQQQIESHYDRCKLTIVDPAWRTLVPELTQYRMGAHQP